jgi:hypothetical protein
MLRGEYVGAGTRGIGVDERCAVSLSVYAREAACGCYDLLGTAAASERFNCGFR